ncbi:MAG TPA: alpha-xylosidase [Pseudomonadales bacterium]|nr:alpha-xylosidase [Pseudomonadales bacterium]
MPHFDPANPDWNNLPALSVTADSYQLAGDRLLLETSEGTLTVSLFDEGLRLSLGTPARSDYGMLIKDPTPHSLEVAQTPEKTTVKGGDHTLILNHHPLSFTLFKGQRRVQTSPSDGHFVRDFRLPPFAKVEGGWFVSLELASSEAVYGLGEKWGKLDKRGQLIRSYNHDALGVNAEISYKNSPFAWSHNGWGMFVHTPAPVTHGVGYAQWSQRAYGIFIEDDHVDLFILSCNDGTEAIHQYTELTGKAPVPPNWSLGVILSKAYYKDADELLATAKAVREKGMPCDVITLDGRAWQDTDTRFAFEWDAKRYPDPAVVLNQLKAMDFKICIWEYPLVSVQNPLFDEMSEKGWLLKDDRTGETYRYQWDMSCFGPVLTPLPDSGIVDFTHPDAYAFWRDCHKPLFDLGIDMIKADFGEQIEPHMLAYNGDRGERLHNAYTLLYNRCVYEAAEKYCQSGPFLFSRSSWIGSQRYPSQWGGDPQADWGGLAGSIRGALSWGMTGGPFFATDVGGFYGDKRDAELYARWIQAAVFSAHMRLHGIGQREPWSYGPAAEAAANKALELRYQLLPYLAETMQQAHTSGLPVQRAMVLACPNERAAWAFEDQFMFGDKILVAPCVNPGGKVECYLPRSHGEAWIKYPCGTRFEAGRSHHFDLALDEIAMFIPEGSHLPLGASVKTTAELGSNLSATRFWPENR